MVEMATSLVGCVVKKKANMCPFWESATDLVVHKSRPSLSEPYYIGALLIRISFLGYYGILCYNYDKEPHDSIG